jgi:NAD(P)-dependent dehydrogenase (short-subunit alcohol dehydrogenase family)
VLIGSLKRRSDFLRVDILVNNAGVCGPIGPTHEVDWDAWVPAIEINLLGVVYACRAVTPLMINLKSGKIINYAASKAAFVHFTESLAHDLKSHGIEVNAIGPGALDTRLLDQVLTAGPEAVGADFYERMVKIKNQGGTPLSVGADLALYLASDASNGITGRLISAARDKWSRLHERAQELDASDVYTLRRIVPADRGLAWDD